MEKPTPARRASRFPTDLPASLEGPGGSQSCYARNLSRSGALLVGALVTRAGEEVHVRLSSTGGDVEVQVRVTVARVEPDPEETNLVRVAVGFHELDDDTKEGIETLIARVLEAGGVASLESVPTGAGPEQIRVALEKVPLAQRLALAPRAAASRDRGLLMLDPQPQVLEALARNPHLQAPEVRLLLRQPGLLPSTLEILGRDSRWRSSDELRVAIAAHHVAPVALVEQIAETLSRPALETLLRQASLNPAARRKLGTKRPTR